MGVKKRDILEGMKSSRYKQCLFGADEVGDFRAAMETGYDTIFMASYGFDNRKRLISEGGVPTDIIFDTPKELAKHLGGAITFKSKLVRAISN